MAHFWEWSYIAVITYRSTQVKSASRFCAAASHLLLILSHSHSHSCCRLSHPTISHLPSLLISPLDKRAMCHNESVLCYLISSVKSCDLHQGPRILKMTRGR